LAAPQNIIDIDSHEMVPSHMWGKVFGKNSAKMEEILRPLFVLLENHNDFYRPEITADDTPMTEDSVWNIRGVKAPGSFDPDRRIEAMNLMGIERQLVFPSCALFAFGRRFTEGQVARDCISEYNDWAARTTLAYPRLRPVAILAMDGTPQEALAEAQRLVDSGVRAVQIGVNLPPCGLSPAATELDPIWALLERENIAVTGHIGEIGFLKDDWAKGAPLLAIEKATSLEIGFSPYQLSVIHYPAMNYLTAMVLGGVFERFPKLRVGMIEFGAAWFGEFAENLDVWANMFKRRLDGHLSLKPSQYLARNVRVTPFHFEAMDLYLTRHPDLAQSYCYSTDYPHMEGGKQSKNTVLAKLEPLGADIIGKYFHDNGALLAPV
jgi:predicted TIM-barrel fold metal-dependent hydrolase